MIEKLHVTEFLEATTGLPILDVRSPAEHAAGHLPHSTSFPLFSNEERAIVGTLYKQKGRQVALIRGLELVGPRMATMVTEAMRLSPQMRVGVHCWRGGMRSGSMAWLLSTAGFYVYTLIDGYKAYRRTRLEAFEQLWKVQILGGSTGSGKTLTLHALRELGEQVLDLEALANHRGSTFGAIGMPPAPTQEQFENEIGDVLLGFDPSKRIWVESESRHVGSVTIPLGIWTQMESAPTIALMVPVEERIKILVDEYGILDTTLLAEAITRIQKRLGPNRTKEALDSLEAKDFAQVARLTLEYYDKTYFYGLDKRPKESVTRFALETIDPAETARKLLKLVDHE